MENLIETLNEIVRDFEKNENPTREEYESLKNREFELFDKIETIKELCEYYKTDMTLDKMPQQFISGLYSGVVNGSMFVIKSIRDVMNKAQTEELTDNEIIEAMLDKLELIQGFKGNK